MSRVGNVDVDPEFQLLIKSGNVEIVAEMPEELNVNVEQDWENPFKVALSDKLQGLIQGLAQFSDRLDDRFTLAWDHEQLFTYMGGSPLQLSFEIVFTAEDSTEDDIVKPVKQLMMLSSPSVASSQVGEQAREFFESATGREGEGLRRLNRPPMCTVKMGNILLLQKIIITSVNPNFSRPLVSDARVQGVPARLPVNLTIQTTHLMTQDRIQKYFFPNVTA